MTFRAGLGLVALSLVAVGVLLRVAALDVGWFGVDQARDVAMARDVAAGVEAPTVGPTMRRLVRLGAGYYYFWALPYLVSADPLSGYRFAAGLSIMAMLAISALAGRLWGLRALVLTVAFSATHPVWIIDGHVAWAPAALPAIGALLLWVLLAREERPLSAARAALAGALLGLAVQLHLTMAVWAIVVGLLMLFERPGRGVLVAGLLGAFLTGAPALYAVVAGSAGEGGLTSLAGTDAIDLCSRLRGALSVGWRIPMALSRWADVELGGAVSAAATAVMTVLVLGGLGRLLGRWRTSRSARLVPALTVAGGGAVVLLPGQTWWYYLDGLLPVAALAAGACVAPNAAAPWPRREWLVIAAALVASVVLGMQGEQFLSHADRHGYLAVEPRLLTLDARPAEDAAVPGRMLSVRWQRAFAEHAATQGGTFDELWGRLHGPAVGDVTSDNGFWLRWALARRPQPEEDGTHLMVWYGDTGVAPSPGAGRETSAIGPLRVARYLPVIDYASCRATEGAIAVPIRSRPHPKRYGDGRPARPRDLPDRIDCALRAGAGLVRVVARLTGPGTVRLRAGAASSPAAAETALCLRGGTSPPRFVIELDLPPDAAATLDLYDVLDPACAGEGA